MAAHQQITLSDLEETNGKIFEERGTANKRKRRQLKCFRGETERSMEDERDCIEA